MANENRWGEDRYRQDPYRTEDPYGRADLGEAYTNRSGGRGDRDRYDRSGSDDNRAGGRSGERPFFTDNGGYNPYADTRPSYGRSESEFSRYGRGYSQGRSLEGRNTGSVLHEGYRAPFGGASGDPQGFTPYGRSDARSDYAGSRYGQPGQAEGSERGVWDRTRDEFASWFGDDEAAQRRRQDELRAGQHRGRGPKGYVRSDDRIREDVNDRLTDDHMLDATDIEVKVASGEVTLSGHIPNRHDKRRAEDLAEQVLGVTHVQNNLRVKDTADAGTYGSGATAQPSTTQSLAQKNN